MADVEDVETTDDMTSEEAAQNECVVEVEGTMKAATVGDKVKQEDEDTEEQSVSLIEDKTTSDSVVVKNKPCTIVWEWENDGSVWTSFSPVHTSAIHDAFKSGLKKMDIFIHDLKFNVIFERMVQRNSKTYWERRIRARGSEDDDGGVSGKFQHTRDGVKWISYDHVGQRLIHAANLYNVTGHYYTKGTRFQIDLVAMEQLNMKTKDVDQIRLKPVGEENDEEEIENNVIPERRHTSGRGIKKENRTPDEKPSVNQDDSDKQSSLPTKSKSTKRKVETEDNKEVVRTINVKGKAPVDDECFVKNQYHVYYEGSIVYDAMLNQTNLKNNNNKFFLMQLLKKNGGGGGMSLFCRF